MSKPDCRKSSFTSHWLNSFWRVLEFWWTAVVKRIRLVLIRPLFQPPAHLDETTLSNHSWTNTGWSPNATRLPCLQQKKRRREKDDDIQMQTVQSPHVQCTLFWVVAYEEWSTTLHITDGPTPLSVSSTLLSHSLSIISMYSLIIFMTENALSLDLTYGSLVDSRSRSWVPAVAQ